MDSHFKKFAADAGSFFNRAKQYTEEKLGQAEKTEYDAHFENLLQRADKTGEFTQKILDQTKAVLVPDPTARAEDAVLGKLDKKKERLTNTEELGNYMIDAGNEFGPGTSYGNALVKVGQTETKLGLAEKDFAEASNNNFIQPLRAFLDGDMKTMQKERKTLESKRLDLDAAKSKLRRAKTQNTKDTEKELKAVEKAEGEVRSAQAEFDRQAEITRLLLEGISSTHVHHLRCLHDFVEAQTNYYAQCQQYMADLTRQLGSFALNSGMGGGSMSPTIHAPIYNQRPTPSAPPAIQINSTPTENGSSAKVLYDYDAADMKELSLKADEVITVYSIPGMDCGWMMGERGAQRGKIPISYIQILDR